MFLTLCKKSIEAADFAESSWELEKYSLYEHEEAANGKDRFQKVIQRKEQMETKAEVKKLPCLMV